MLGYGIILITHAKTTTEKIDDETTITKVAPNIPERAQDIVNALVDIIGYIDVKWQDSADGPVSIRTLITRGTPTVVAGSRLKYLESKIPFGYHELTEAIGVAIEKQQNMDGAVVTEKSTAQAVIEKRPFEETVAEAKSLWERIVTKDESLAETIMNKAETIFGAPTRLSEIPESKQDLFELLIEEMRTM
jgi:hypothetical protein